MDLLLQSLRSLGRLIAEGSEAVAAKLYYWRAAEPQATYCRLGPYRPDPAPLAPWSPTLVGRPSS